MTSPTRRIGMVATLALLIAAPAASAETYKTTYGAGQANAFAWEGEATGLVSIPSVISNGCGTFEPIFRCDLVVFDVKDAGDLEASVTMDDAPVCDPTAAFCTVDVDLYLFKSDAEGAHDSAATPVASSATAEQTEALKAKVTPGFYVLEVEPYQGQDVTYEGTSKFTGPPAPTPPPPTIPAPPAEPATQTPAAPQPQSQPAPATAQQPQQSQPAPKKAAAKKKTGKRAACQKKAKKIKNAKKRKKALKACKKKSV